MDEKKILEKFDTWVKNMPEKLKRYYLAKTSYWVVTESGKNIAMKSYQFEQEFRKKMEEKDE